MPSHRQGRISPAGERHQAKSWFDEGDESDVQVGAAVAVLDDPLEQAAVDRADDLGVGASSIAEGACA